MMQVPTARNIRWPGVALGCMLVCSGAVGRAEEPSATAPPLDQVTADCNHSAYATDQLVCGDSVLQTLDAEMAKKVAQVEQRALWPGTVWFEDQKAWFKRRSLCAFEQDQRDCAAAAYRTRLVELGAALAPQPGLHPIECGLSARWRASSVMENDALLVYDTDGKMVLVALPPTTAKWSSWVTYRVSGRQMTFRRFGDALPLKCRIGKSGD